MKICVLGATAVLAAMTGACAPARNGAAFLHGYAGQLSYVAGDTLTLHISTSFPRHSVVISRLGGTREEVWRDDHVPGKTYPTPRDAYANGCGWPPAVTMTVPESWRSGCYAATTGMNDPVDPRRWIEGQTIFFVVRSPRPGRDTPILLQMSTNTWNAYNNWGGKSLYNFNSAGGERSTRVSFQRPIPGEVYQRELPFIQWAERQGYILDYAVNADLEFHPELLDHYRLVLSVGHDEYWSAKMRDHLEAFVGRGGNVAFFSGNVSCWQVRFSDDGTGLLCYKSSFTEDPTYQSDGPNPTLTTLWSHPLVNRPENMMTGVGMQWGGYHRSHGQLMDGSGAFTVHRPEHWVFEGTGLGDGDSFGGEHTIVGYECDGCEYTLVAGKPEPTGQDGTPRDFVILATAPAQWGAAEWEGFGIIPGDRVGNACMGVHTRRGGGTVFTSGTTDWAHGLAGGDRVVERVTRNVLDRLSRRD